MTVGARLIVYWPLPYVEASSTVGSPLCQVGSPLVVLTAPIARSSDVTIVLER